MSNASPFQPGHFLRTQWGGVQLLSWKKAASWKKGWKIFSPRGPPGGGVELARGWRLAGSDEKSGVGGIFPQKIDHLPQIWTFFPQTFHFPPFFFQFPSIFFIFPFFSIPFFSISPKIFPFFSPAPGFAGSWKNIYLAGDPRGGVKQSPKRLLAGKKLLAGLDPPPYDLKKKPAHDPPPRSHNTFPNHFSSHFSPPSKPSRDPVKIFFRGSPGQAGTLPPTPPPGGP